ncbi:MAG: hypothetical protein RQM95_12740 [Syntrophaceticus schinkii]
MDWWTQIDRSLRLNLVVNNTRFRSFPGLRKKPGQQSLSLAAKRIRSDWQKLTARYLETFVNQRNTGAPVTRQQTGSTGRPLERPDGPSYKKLLTPRISMSIPWQPISAPTKGETAHE